MRQVSASDTSFASPKALVNHILYQINGICPVFRTVVRFPNHTFLYQHLK